MADSWLSASAIMRRNQVADIHCPVPATVIKPKKNKAGEA